MLRQGSRRMVCWLHGPVPLLTRWGTKGLLVVGAPVELPAESGLHLNEERWKQIKF